MGVGAISPDVWPRTAVRQNGILCARLLLRQASVAWDGPCAELQPDLHRGSLSYIDAAYPSTGRGDSGWQGELGRHFSRGEQLNASRATDKVMK